MAKIKVKKKTVPPSLKLRRAKKKAPMPKPMKVQGKLVGKILHYFSDIKVGVIKVSGVLSKGDKIRIMGGESTDFNQNVDSMQVDHKEVKKTKKGDSVGLKVKEKVREGYKVYKI